MISSRAGNSNELSCVSFTLHGFSWTYVVNSKLHKVIYDEYANTRHQHSDIKGINIFKNIWCFGK